MAGWCYAVREEEIDTGRRSGSNGGRERKREKIGVWLQVLQAEHFHFSLRRWLILRRVAIPLWCICVCACLPVCLCLCVHVLIERCSMGTFKEQESVHKNANVVRCWAELTQELTFASLQYNGWTEHHNMNRPLKIYKIPSLNTEKTTS